LISLQELSNLLWALTTPAGHKPLQLYKMAELELTTERDLSRFNPQVCVWGGGLMCV